MTHVSENQLIRYNAKTNRQMINISSLMELISEKKELSREVAGLEKEENKIMAQICYELYQDSDLHYTTVEHVKAKDKHLSQLSESLIITETNLIEVKDLIEMCFIILGAE